MPTGRMGSPSRSPAAPTWMWTGAGARPAATPSCREASASSEQVLPWGGHAGAWREADRVGDNQGLEMASRWGPPGALCASLQDWVPNVLWDPGTLFPSPQRTVCSPGAPRTHKWSYSGSCPKSLEDSSWIPFRDHCYTFHMEITLGQKDAMRRCQKGTGGLWWL